MAKKVWFTCPHCGLQLQLNPKLSYACTRCSHFPMSLGQFIVVQPQQPRVTVPFQPPPTPSGSLPTQPGAYPPGQMLPPRPNQFNILMGRLWRWYRGQSRNVQIGIAAALAVLLVVCALIGNATASSAQQSVNATATAQTIAQATANAPTPTPTPGTPTPTPTPSPTPTPTKAPTWTTIQHFSGNGNKKTGYFDVPVNWRLVWTCDPASFYGSSYNLIVEVRATDTSLLDGAVNTICQAGNTHDYTDEHVGGQQVYLDIISEAQWTLDVQVLK